MQLIKGGGCHGGVIWLTHNVRQSKAQVTFSYYEFITCPCMNPCSVSGCSTHVFSVLRCVLFVPSWFVSRWVRTPKHSKCYVEVQKRFCGTTAVGSVITRSAVADLDLWGRDGHSTDLQCVEGCPVLTCRARVSTGCWCNIDVRVDVSVSSVVGLCCNEWQYVYDQCQCGPWC